MGRGWVAALGALLIPVYVRMMGVEAYALVGIHATLQTIFGLLDLGLGAGLNREIARLSTMEGGDDERRDLLATFDLIGVVIGIAVIVIVYFAAPFIAYRWVNATELPRSAIVDAIRMIAVIIGLQLPIGFYQGGMSGLEKQVLSNMLWIGLQTIRGLGAVLALMLVAPTVRVFFAWQLVVTMLIALVYGFVLHRLVDRKLGWGRPRRDLLKRVWRYSAGWIGNSVGTSFLGLADKVVLSRILTLKDFGYYTFASYGATLLLNLIMSVSEAFFPRFNRLIARNDEAGLAIEYRRGNQTLASLLIPVACVLLFFSREAVFVWTRDATLTDATATLMAIFVAGITLFGTAHIAYVAALSKGMFRTTMKMTAVLSIICVPALLIVPKYYGVIGAAVVWAVMNGGRVAVVPLLHQRYIAGEGRMWLKQALVAPLIAAGSVGAVARYFAPHFHNAIATLAYLGGTWVLMVIAVLTVEPAVRGAVFSAARRVAARVSQ